MAKNKKHEWYKSDTGISIYLMRNKIKIPFHKIRLRITAKVLNLLGHGPSSQPVDSCKSPTQLTPPYSGTGLLHSRVLVCVPVLQVTVHVFHSLQSVKPPSTEINSSVCMYHKTLKQHKHEK